MIILYDESAYGILQVVQQVYGTIFTVSRFSTFLNEKFPNTDFSIIMIIITCSVLIVVYVITVNIIMIIIR